MTNGLKGQRTVKVREQLRRGSQWPRQEQSGEKRRHDTVMKVTENAEARRGSGVTPRSAPESNKQNLPEKDPIYFYYKRVVQNNSLFRGSTNYLKMTNTSQAT